MKYEQRVIIRFLTNEGIEADQIHVRLCAQFGEQTYALRTIRTWILEIRRGRQDMHDEPRSGRPVLDHIDTKIVSMLEKAPFESARSIAQVLNVDHATVLHHLTERLGLKSYCLRWVPHLLTDDLKAKRKEFAEQMIPYLEAARKDGWKHLVTGDESWFFS
jgi:hypothetical protein